MRQFRQIFIWLSVAVASLPASAGAPVDSGALDPMFGSGGKVQLGPAPGYTSPVANDAVVQPDGRIVVVGYETTSPGGYENWRITRLNVDGSTDPTFAPDHSGTVHYFAGSTGTRAQSVALRADGRIVVGGNYYVGSDYSESDVMQLTASGALDGTFAGNTGYVEIPSPSADRNYLSRLILEANGSVDIAGTYYANQSGFNSNEFFFARISVDGQTVEPFQYLLGSGPNADDHAQDLAIDNQGRYVVVGYHRGASGNYDFAAIRIRSDLYDVDDTFGSGGQTTVDFKDNGDYANAVALTPTGYIALGGQAIGQAAIALLDPDGNLYTYYLGDQSPPAKFTFVFGVGDGNDTISKLIFDDYDTFYPQLLAIGSGYQSYASGPGGAAGLMFGIARLNLPDLHANFSLDAAFNGRGTEGVYFNVRPNGIGSFITTNNGRSAALDKGKLLMVGDTLGTRMAIGRLAAFDGIYKNGLDNPKF